MDRWVLALATFEDVQESGSTQSSVVEARKEDYEAAQSPHHLSSALERRREYARKKWRYVSLPTLLPLRLFYIEMIICYTHAWLSERALTGILVLKHSGFQ